MFVERFWHLSASLLRKSSTFTYWTIRHARGTDGETLLPQVYGNLQPEIYQTSPH